MTRHCTRLDLLFRAPGVSFLPTCHKGFSGLQGFPLSTQVGAVRPLVQLLSDTDEALQEAAARCLQNLSLLDKNRESIGLEGAIPPLLVFLEHGNLDMKVPPPPPKPPPPRPPRSTLSSLHPWDSRRAQPGGPEVLVTAQMPLFL